MAMTGTSIALPEIGRDLDASGAALQWVVTGYILAASSVMLVSGSLGDLFGRRRMYATGAALYAAGTLTAATADDVLVLDVARTLAGVGGAAVMAGGSAILATVFEGPARTRVFAAMGTVAGMGIAVGPTLSGRLVGAFGWRATFLAFGVAGLLILLGTRLMPESRSATRPRVDLPGAATFIAGLSLLMFALTQGADAGWGSVRVLGPMAAGAVLLAVFVVVERRSGHPLLDLSLVRDPRFMGWTLGAMFVAGGATGVLVFLPTYLQGASGLTAEDAGLVMLMATAPVFLLPSFGGRLVSRGVVPPQRLIVGALLLSAAGNGWLAVALTPDAGPLALAGPLLLIGTGNGLAMGQIDAQAMSIVEPDRIGMASGLLNTARSGMGALVLAGFGAALTSLVEGRIGDRALAAEVVAGRHPALAPDFTAAWRVTELTVTLVLLASALLVHHLLRTGRSPAAPPASLRTSRTDNHPARIGPTAGNRPIQTSPAAD